MAILATHGATRKRNDLEKFLTKSSGVSQRT
jgi:hypothetical protein